MHAPALKLAPAMEAQVRQAGPMDYSEVCRLMLLAHGENGLFPANHNKVGWWIGRFLTMAQCPPEDTGPRGAIGVIGSPGGKLEALAMTAIGCQWYSDQKFLEEFLVFVDPDFRRTRHIHALIAWLKEQADACGIPLLTGIISNTRTEAKIKLYRRQYHLEPAGAYFLYLPEGVQWNYERNSQSRQTVAAYSSAA